MKSKLVILSLLMAGTAVSATAQTKEKFYSESAKDNFFISVAGGVQGVVNPDNFDYGFGNIITPVINLSLGKLITPVWGVRGQVAGAWTSLYSQYAMPDGSFNNGMPNGTFNKIKNKHYITLRADGMFNVSNAIGGYNPNRLFTVTAFAGPGLTFAKAYGDRDKINALINGSVGLGGQFNISKCLDINIEARGEVSPSVFGAQSSAYNDGAISLVGGFTYTFGGKKFISCAKIDQDAINAELNKYRDALAKAQSDLADARNALANVKPVSNNVVKEIQVAGPRAIFFQIGKSKIDDYGRVNIELAAKILKANPDKKYKIAGYADKATGNTTWNQNISDKRAQAVYDALIKEGVSKDQIELVGFGGTDNMFGKDFLNRVVILE